MSKQELSALPQKPSGVPFLSTDDTELVSLNLVLEHALQTYTDPLKNGRLVARCEPLPSVRGEVSGLKFLFEYILSLVLKQDEAKTPQYLYVDCSVETSDVLDLTLNKGFCYYYIQFKTNKKQSLQATAEVNALLETCNEILKASKGTLQIFCVEGEGCLFSILLQGKMN